MKKPLKLPKFKSDEEEFDFWSKLDLSEYFDFSDLKPFDLEKFLLDHQTSPTTRVTLQVPTTWIYKLKEKATHLDMSYQSLLKRYIQNGLQTEI